MPALRIRKCEIGGPEGQSRSRGTAREIRLLLSKPGNSPTRGLAYAAAGTTAQDWRGTSSQPLMFWLTCTNTFEPTFGDPYLPL